MKRSEINKALKEMEAMIKEYRFALKSGRRKATNTMRFGITC